MFIKVHTYSDGNAILVNLNEVLYITSVTNADKIAQAYIAFRTTSIWTKETIDEIEALIYGKENPQQTEKVEEKVVKTYFYITDDFGIWLTRDDGEEVDMARKEVGNYFETFDEACRARDRMIEILGRRQKKSPEEVAQAIKRMGERC